MNTGGRGLDLIGSMVASRIGSDESKDVYGV